MTAGFDVPVALLVFNRPDFVRRVMAVLAVVRPSTLIVVADGPRDGHDDDATQCALARQEATPTWPCQVIEDWSDVNLGCDRRLRSGLDGVFARFDRAVVVEDDIVAHPSFFAWCERQLDRYAGDPTVGMVSGHNDLGRWGTGTADHLIVRMGSVHGWAGWASAWNDQDRALSMVHDPDIERRLDDLWLDPLTRDHTAMLVRLVREGQLSAWDNRWSLSHLLADRWSVVPPVNLTANVGYGDRATRTTFDADFRAATPVFPAPEPSAPDVRPVPDPGFDRAWMLAQLLATYRRPEMALRLAARRHLLVDQYGARDELAVHLAPIDHLEESIDVLRHLRSAGFESASLERTLAALEGARSTGVGR